MEDSQHVSIWSSYSLLINFTVGSGVLSIPWAYDQGGLVLGIVSQFYASLITLIMSFEIIQIISRVQKIKRMQSEGYQISPVPFTKLFAKTHPKDFIKFESKNEDIESLSESELVISEHIHDLTEITNLLMGNTHGLILNISLSLSMISCLIAYSSIFSSSLASIIPIGPYSTCNIYEDTEYFGDSCWRKYWFFMAIFLIITSFFTVTKVKEQVWFQATMSIIRFLIVALIIITCIVSLIQDKNLDDDDENEGEIVLFNWRGLGVTIPIIVFSINYFSFIPNAIQWVEYKKKNIPALMKLSAFTFTLVYLCVGIFTSIAIKDIDQMITLEWEGYTGGHSEKSWWSIAIEYTVIIFPALDMISIFPLVSINTAENFMTSIGMEYKQEGLDNLKVTLFRLSVTILPILISVYFYEVGYVGSIAGIFAIINSGFYIPLISIASKKIITQKGEYDNVFSEDWWAWFTFYTQCAFFMLCSVTLIIKIFS